MIVCTILVCAVPTWAQQKGQYQPGQYGLNAGVVADPGVTYMNWAQYYSASQLNNASGDKITGLSGTYSFWVDQNIFMWVGSHKFLGGYFAPYVSVNVANGNLVADIVGTNLKTSGGGDGLADTYVQPLNLAWHLKRADVNVGYGFMAPTGRYRPGASDNIGSGYWGNNITTGTTFYLTKDKGTSANLFTDWETHGSKTTALGTTATPGKAFTMEWGFGQVLPLKKDFSRLLQAGVIGYDQWQVGANGGLASASVPASALPYYSVHAVGFQANYILPAKNLIFFFKYEDEFKAMAHPQGHTIMFGGSWTLRIPKPAPAPAAAPAPADAPAPPKQ